MLSGAHDALEAIHLGESQGETKDHWESNCPVISRMTDADGPIPGTAGESPAVQGGDESVSPILQPKSMA